MWAVQRTAAASPVSQIECDQQHDVTAIDALQTLMQITMENTQEQVPRVSGQCP